MQIDKEIAEVSGTSAIALGFFDGVHIAHAEVIREAVAFAPTGAVPTVLTFHFDGELPGNKLGMKAILTQEQKLERFETFGLERVVLPEFGRIAGMPPERFFWEILVERLHAVLLSCGYDYSFGKDAAGGTELLRQLCGKAGIELRVLPPMERDGVPVSSTRIRELLRAGEIPAANVLLGYGYYILGEVVHGRSLGRTLGFPTLNQRLLHGQAVPRFGVYNSTTKIAGDTYPSITNIGVKPTIEGERAPLAETYLLGADADFYGQIARVELLEMTRPEQKFNSLEELRTAVHQDIANREKWKA